MWIAPATGRSGPASSASSAYGLDWAATDVVAGVGAAPADRVGCAAGLSNKDVARREGGSQPTVGKWWARFVELRLDGLGDDPRLGRPPSITAEQVEDVVVATLESTPANATHWSRAKMAERRAVEVDDRADLERRSS